jgi:hypothetical protein
MRTYTRMAIPAAAEPCLTVHTSQPELRVQVSCAHLCTKEHQLLGALHSKRAHACYCAVQQMPALVMHVQNICAFGPNICAYVRVRVVVQCAWHCCCCCCHCDMPPVAQALLWVLRMSSYLDVYFQHGHSCQVVAVQRDGLYLLS